MIFSAAFGHGTPGAMMRLDNRIARPAAGGVMVETAVVLSILVLLLGLLIDIHFHFTESSALKEAARFGARVAASAPEKGLSHDDLPAYALRVTGHSLEAAGLDPENYHIDFRQRAVDGKWDPENPKLMYYVQISVSRKRKNRFYLIPETALSDCKGHTDKIESRLPFESELPDVANPDCNTWEPRSE